MSQRGSHGEEFNPDKLSPSRMNSLVSCGVAFERKYIMGQPELRSGSAALFGSVMHDALEHWCVNRQGPLVPLVRQAWLRVTEGDVARDFIGAYQALSLDAIKEEARIREARPEIKVVRMTGDWKKSKVAGQINALMKTWHPKLKGSMWRFRDSSLKDGTLVAELPALYDESLQLARRYEARWKHLPNALFSEIGFDVKWEGYILNGYIDAIEPILSAKGDVEAIAVMDYKSYAREPALHKDWRQFAMYDIAVRIMRERGEVELPDVPIFVGADYLRLTPKPGESYPSRRIWQMTDADVDRLRREALAYRAIVDGKAFLPAEKGRNPDYCPFPDDCCLMKAPAIQVNPEVFDRKAA